MLLSSFSHRSSAASACALILQAAYVLSCVAPPLLGGGALLSPASGAILKALPAALLAAASLFGPSAASAAAAAALACGAAGDFLLDAPPFPAALGAEGAFLAGLASFLLGHLAYCNALLRRGVRLGGGAGVRAALVPLVPTLALLAALAPALPRDLVLPVVAYAAASAALAALALALAPPSGWAVAGALLFLSSDALLAVDRFLSPLPAGKLLVMLTYYGAQDCFFVAFAGAHEKRR